MLHNANVFSHAFTSLAPRDFPAVNREEPGNEAKLSLPTTCMVFTLEVIKNCRC